MTARTTAAPAPATAARLSGTYISLVSFRRDGTPVATPVWFVVDGERLLAITDAHSAKVKRIRRNPDVTVAPCKPDGRVTGASVAARATILPLRDLERAQMLIARKYRVDRVLILPVYNVVQRLRGRRPSGEAVALAITPTAPAGP
jgi:PPOX class probable F420-dependent enzyme